jgi:hypothetical protein
MIEKIFDRILDALRDKRPVTHDVDGQVYAVKADGTLGEPVRALAPLAKPTFIVTTLAGLVELWKAKLDDFSEKDAGRSALHVANYRQVNLVSLEADEFGHRHVFATATHTAETPFKFNTYLPAEKFIIDFRTSFLLTDDGVKVLKVCSNLEAGQAVSTADDGLSQRLEVKAGTTTKAEVVLPVDGIPLIPWRTFRDAAPVESKFLLRLKTEKNSVPGVALFDIDQKWQLDTVNEIARYLRKHLPDATIIA